MITHGEVIPIIGRQDLVWDPHRNRLYITTVSGVLERFDAVNRLLMEPWDIGESLLGADITPDGQYLFVTDEVDTLDQPQIHRVDLDAGDTTSWSFPPAFIEGRTWDIKIVSDTKGFVTTRFNGSGWVPFRDFEVSGAGFVRWSWQMGVIQEEGVRLGLDRRGCPDMMALWCPVNGKCRTISTTPTVQA